MQTTSETDVRAEINVTPLVDVVLVLLIIFMVVTPMMVTQGIELPKGAHSKKVAESDRSRTISLTAQGVLFFDQEPVSEILLGERLRGLYGRNPEAQVILRADRRVQYGDVHHVLDLAATVGFHNLSLLADPGAGTPATEPVR